MYKKRTEPYEKLTTIGEHYEVTVMEDVPFEDEKERIIYGEFRGWEYDEDRGNLYAVIWEVGKSRGEPYFSGDILSVKKTKP